MSLIVIILYPPFPFTQADSVICQLLDM